VELSVVIPIYQAGAMIEDTVNRLTVVLEGLNIDYELLLRDDGSTDTSRELLKKIESGFSMIRCFYNERNRGVGFTLRQLFHDAHGRIIIYCDCDLPFGEQIIPLLYSKASQSDIVVASRYRGVRNDVTMIRKIVSRMYYGLCKLFFNIPVKDIGSGSVAIRRDVLDQLRLNADGFVVHAELFVKSLRQNLVIEEVGAKTLKNSTGTFKVWRHGLKALYDTIKLWLKIL